MVRRENATQVQNGRKAGVKVGAMLLMIAILGMALMGCNGKKEDEGKVGANELLYQVPEYKAVTDFEENGEKITAQDVLNALDYLCYMETKNLYYGNEEVGDDYDYLSAQFTSITTIPFYRWTEENKIEWKENPFYYTNGSYQVKVSYQYALHEESNPDYVLYDFIEFDKVLEAVGAGKIIPTWEYLQSVDGFVGGDIVLGLEVVYEPVEITRELIASITDENILRTFLTEIGTYIQQCEDRLVYCQENDVAPVPIVASDILDPKADKGQLLYPIPEMKTMAYFEESGEKITAQDVLNALDYLCYVRGKTNYYGFEAYGKEGFEETYKYMSCRFTSITTSTPAFYSGERDSAEYKEWRTKNLPFFEKLDSGNLNIKINFQEAFYQESSSSFIRCSIVGFDKVLDALGTGKIRVTEQYLESIGDLEGFRHFLGEEVYESVDVTRELILTIEDETVLTLLLADIDISVQTMMTDFELRLKHHDRNNPMWYQFMMQ